jgi:hypothetical protein
MELPGIVKDRYRIAREGLDKTGQNFDNNGAQEAIQPPSLLAYHIFKWIFLDILYIC